MAAGFSVQIDDLRAAAAAFTQLRAHAAGVLGAPGLGDIGGMAGRDPVLAAWRARYDAMVAAQWAASTTAVTTLGAIATKMADTADTYRAAEHDATTRMGGRPGRQQGRRDRAPGAGVAPPPDAAGPPSSTGPGGPDLPDTLAEYYPGGDPERLRAAAAYWSALANGMGRIADTGDAAFRRLAHTGDGAAFSAMRTFWAARFTPCATEPLFNAVANGAALLRDSCRDLAELIEHTRAAVRGAAAEAIEDMGPLELPARLLGPLTWNVSELELLAGTGALAVAYLNDYRDAYLFALDRLVELLRPEDEQRLRRVAVPPAPDAPVGVGLADVGQITRLELTGTRWDGVFGPHPTPDSIHVPHERVVHILRGDENGGGHAPGTGIPGKSEFPRGWDDARILAATLSVARGPDMVAPTRGGRLRVEGTRDGVLIRVILEPDGDVVTSVPVSGPGVVRNPGGR